MSTNPSNKNTSHTVVTRTNTEVKIIDLYSIGHNKDTKKPWKENKVPFIHNIELLGPRGEIIRVRALFDEGTMVGAMCSLTKYTIDWAHQRSQNNSYEWKMGY